MESNQPPYPNPDCKKHRCPYGWNGTWWECMDYKHPMPKVYCLVREESTYENSSEWEYVWKEIHEVDGGADIAIKLDEDIYKLIQNYYGA